MFWTDNCVIPKGAVHKGTAELMIDYCYVPEHAAQIEAGVAYVTPVKGVQEIFAASTGQQGAGDRPAALPAGRARAEARPVRDPQRGRRDVLQRAVREGDRRLSRLPIRSRGRAMVAMRRRRSLIPYLLLAPGLLWLVVFFAWPLLQVFLASFWSGSVEQRLHVLALELDELPGRDRAGPAARRPIAPVLAHGDGPDAPHRLSARLHHRHPRRPVQEPAAVPGRRAVLHELPAAHAVAGRSSSATTASSSGRSRTSASCPMTSACWRRRWPWSPASPTTSCRS